MPLCEYGCKNEGIFQFQNGKWCCSQIWQKCPAHRERNRKNMTGKKNPIFGKKHSPETIKKIRMKALGRNPWNKGIPRSTKTKKILKEKLKGREPWNKGKAIYSYRRTIELINEKYPFFSQIEEMRYNPNKVKIKEIQVHCKNHNCPNSKEKGGWFTPSGRQIEFRIKALEKDENDLSYFYCCEECKDVCPLYNLHSDPFKNNELPYTQTEKDIFNKEVLRRQRKEDGYNFCEKCYSIKDLHVHHEKPVKTHPYLSLDPDNGIVLCEECHYKYGHKTGTECSTGNLAKIVCSK